MIGHYDKIMAITIEKKIQKGLREVSRQMGMKEKELIDRALLLYIESVKKTLDIEREFKEWDALSDESLCNLSGRLSARL